MHAPLGSDRDIWIQTLHDVSWPDNRHIRANGFYLLLTDPLSTQASALRIGVSSSSRYVDEALDVWRVLYGLGDGDGHADVGLLELLILFVEDMGADAGDGNVRALKCESDLFLISHVLEFDIGLIAEIRRRLDFLEPVIPRSGQLTVREDNLGANTSQRTRCGHTKRTRAAKDCRVDAAVRVALAFFIDVEAL